MASDDKEYTMKLDFFGTQGAYHCMMNTEVKGRSDARNHGRVVKAIKESCMKMKSELEGEFVGGTFDLNQDRFKYLKDSVKRQFDKGIPGSFGEAYCALADALDVAEETADKEEKPKA